MNGQGIHPSWRHTKESTFTDGGNPVFPVNCHLWQLRLPLCISATSAPLPPRPAPSDGWWYGRSWEGCNSPPWLVNCQSIPSALRMKSSRKIHVRQSGCLTDARHINIPEARTQVKTPSPWRRRTTGTTPPWHGHAAKPHNKIDSSSSKKFWCWHRWFGPNFNHTR